MSGHVKKSWKQEGRKRRGEEKKPRGVQPAPPPPPPLPPTRGDHMEQNVQRLTRANSHSQAGRQTSLYSFLNVNQMCGGARESWERPATNLRRPSSACSRRVCVRVCMHVRAGNRECVCLFFLSLFFFFVCGGVRGGITSDGGGKVRGRGGGRGTRRRRRNNYANLQSGMDLEMMHDDRRRREGSEKGSK